MWRGQKTKESLELNKTETNADGRDLLNYVFYTLTHIFSNNLYVRNKFLRTNTRDLINEVLISHHYFVLFLRLKQFHFVYF